MKLPRALNERLRDRFGRFCPPVTTRAPLKNFLLVGGKIVNGELTNHDTSVVVGRLDRLVEAGIPVSPNFEVSIANIDPEQGGEDFLTGKYRADIVALCWIFNPPKLYQSPLFGDFRVSPHHKDQNAWPNAVLRSKAKVLIVDGSHNEVNPEFFANTQKLVAFHQPATMGSTYYLRADYKGPINDDLRKTLSLPAPTR